MSLPAISESVASVSIDTVTALDPFATTGSSSLNYLLSDLLPVTYPEPQIIPKQDIIDDFIESQQIEQPQYEEFPKAHQELLDYADSFLTQFFKENPYRMNVFLTAENEFGVRYFLPAFIRPSALPLIETHTSALAAKFVADLCNYEILYNFFSPPRCITTPSFTVQMQLGDCFDLSVLLCTILTGIGYGAYVVVGYADRELTFADMRYEYCPSLAVKENKEEVAKVEENKYLARVKTRVLSLKSEFDEIRKRPEEDPEPEDTYEPPEDEFKGKRMHCWVLVRPTQTEMSQLFFIDPATGKDYPVDSQRFTGIELIFNHQNVWINMQEIGFRRNDDTMSLENDALWKAVIPENSEIKIPAPIVPRLEIPEELVFQKYPNGQKKTLWRDALEELYAPYTRPDGLTTRYFISNHSLANITEIREKFQSLKDYLVERRLLINDMEMIERFEPDATTSVIEHHIKHDQWRLLKFDPDARLDKLESRLEVFGNKIVEKFKDRDDGMFERKIRIVPISSNSESNQSVSISGHRVERLTQKYRLKKDVPSSHTVTYAITHNVYKVSYDLVNNQMTVVFHHLPGRITNFFIEFKKEREKGYIGEPSKFDPQAPEFDDYMLKETEKNLLLIQEQGLADSRQIADDVTNWIRFRTQQSTTPYLNMKSVDVVLHRKLYKQMEQTGVRVDAPPPEPKAKGQDEANASQFQLSDKDPYSVYFECPPSEMNEENAYKTLDRALEAIKLRMSEEHKALQNRINTESQQLYKKKAEFQMDHHQNLSKKQGEEYSQYCEKKDFLIAVLQKRIQRFPETAQRRLFDLVKGLYNHPVLSPYLKGFDATYEDAKEVLNGIIEKQKDV